MSLGEPVPFARAYEVAERLAGELAPHVARAKVAGSLRRRRPTVSDIEIVVEPLAHADLVGAETADVERVRRVARGWGRVTKSGDRYVQVAGVLGTALKCDLFLVHPPAEWGSILAIRTGPAELGRLAVMRLRDRGLRHTAGHVERLDGGETVPTPDEATFFRLAGLACLPPARRSPEAAVRAAGEAAER